MKIEQEKQKLEHEKQMKELREEMKKELEAAKNVKKEERYSEYIMKRSECTHFLLFYNIQHNHLWPTNVEFWSFSVKKRHIL